MDRSDHKLKIHQIPTNTPQNMITLNRSPRTSRRTLYCIEDHVERRSHLATNYGPKVCGKLLTHHRKGRKDDVEPLRDLTPLRQSAGKGLQMGYVKTRNLR